MPFPRTENMIMSRNIGTIQFVQQLWMLRKDRNWKSHRLL